jgi:MFS family permease
LKLPSYITRNVLLLSIVSLLNDCSSEMLYPIIPLYLASLGTAPILLAWIEGFAEIIAATLKWKSGVWSDASNSRKKFVFAGYSTSVVSRGILALSTNWIGVLIARATDKVGKGIRTTSRDALLTEESDKSTRASVMSFHRSADTIGAIIGPTIAIICLGAAWSYQSIFYLSIGFGLLSILVIAAIQEKQKTTTSASERISLSFFWKSSSVGYKKIIGLFAIFAIGNSSDMYLMLKLKENGFESTICIQYYMLFNIVAVLVGFPIGRLADRYDKRYFLLFGFIAYAASYFLIGSYSSSFVITIGFIIYGFYYACIDSVSKAMIANTCSPNQKAAAFGLFGMIQSVLFLVSGIICGLLWTNFSSATAFMFCAWMVILAVLYLLIYWKSLNE